MKLHLFKIKTANQLNKMANTCNVESKMRVFSRALPKLQIVEKNINDFEKKDDGEKLAYAKGWRDLDLFANKWGKERKRVGEQ